MQRQQRMWILVVLWMLWAVGMPVAVWGQENATSPTPATHTDPAEAAEDWFEPALRLSQTAILSGTDSTPPTVAEGGSPPSTTVSAYRIFLPMVRTAEKLQRPIIQVTYNQSDEDIVAMLPELDVNDIIMPEPPEELPIIRFQGSSLSGADLS